MGKLKNLAPTLTTIRPHRIQAPQGRREYDQQRNTIEWRKWYKTPRWRRLRWTILVRDLFTCRMCGRAEPDTRLLVADHKQPHRGDERMFWDDSNLWCLCKPCHDGAKQRIENRNR